MIKDNISILCLLRQIDTDTHILISNAHLHWDPAFCDVKLIQTAIMLEETERWLHLWNSKHKLAPHAKTTSTIIQTVPVLICGDFNSLPDSGVIELLSTGNVPRDHVDLQNHDYSPIVSATGISHSFDLTHAYANIKTFTNFTPTFCGMIDYIWYTGTLAVTGILGPVDEEYVRTSVGFPNAHHASDHIPLVCSISKR